MVACWDWKDNRGSVLQGTAYSAHMGSPDSLGEASSWQTGDLENWSVRDLLGEWFSIGPGKWGVCHNNSGAPSPDQSILMRSFVPSACVIRIVQMSPCLEIRVDMPAVT